MTREFTAMFIAFSIFFAAVFSASNAAAQQPGGVADVHRACVLQALAKGPKTDLVLGLPLGIAGQPTNVPQVLSPNLLPAEARLDYLIVAAALESCVPFAGLADNSTLTVTVMRSGTVMLAGVPAATADAPLTLPPLALGQAQPTAPAALPAQRDGTAESEAALSLDKQSIRDLQARLQVMGIDPNGIDGSIGSGTRAAIRAWQAREGLAATGYLEAAQVARLRQQSQPMLDQWLLDPANKALHTPPPPIPVGAHNVSGNWRFSATCGNRSKAPGTKVTGVLNMTHNGGGRYSGTLRNSQGLNGRVSARLSGRTVTSTTNYGLLFGKVDFRGRIDDQQLVIRGRDSNGCSVFARKS